MVSQESFQWGLRVFERNSKAISMKFQMCFQECSKKVFRKLQEHFRVFIEIFKGVSRKVQECFKEVTVKKGPKVFK